MANRSDQLADKYGADFRKLSHIEMLASVGVSKALVPVILIEQEVTHEKHGMQTSFGALHLLCHTVGATIKGLYDTGEIEKADAFKARCLKLVEEHFKI